MYAPPSGLAAGPDGRTGAPGAEGDPSQQLQQLQMLFAGQQQAPQPGAAYPPFFPPQGGPGGAGLLGGAPQGASSFYPPAAAAPLPAAGQQAPNGAEFAGRALYGAYPPAAGAEGGASPAAGSGRGLGAADGAEAHKGLGGGVARSQFRGKGDARAGEDAVRAAQEEISKLQHLFAGGSYAPAAGGPRPNGSSGPRGDGRGDRGEGASAFFAEAGGGGAGGARNRDEDDGKSGRMVVFVDYPAAAFSLVPEDVRNFLSVFGTVKQVSLSRRRAAAEVQIAPASAVGVCVQELNETFLPGLGVLRVAPLTARGTPLEDLLPASAADPPGASAKAGAADSPFAGRRRDEPAARRDSGEGGAGGSEARFGGDRGGGDTPSAGGRSRDERERGEGGRKPGSDRRKKVCRLELVDLFTYEPGFDVTRALLGDHNGNISYIMDQTQHKVDLSIKGKAVNEAPVAERLHLSLSSDDPEAYEKALSMAEDLLQSVCEQFVAFCQMKHLPPPLTATFRRHQYEQQGDGSLTYLGVTERPPAWLGSSPSHSPAARGGAPGAPALAAGVPTANAALSAPSAAAAAAVTAAGSPGGAARSQAALAAGAGGLPGPAPAAGAAAALPASCLLSGPPPHLAAPAMTHPTSHPAGALPPPGSQLAVVGAAPMPAAGAIPPGGALPPPLGAPPLAHHPHHPVGLPPLASPPPSSAAAPIAAHRAPPPLAHLPPPGAAPRGAAAAALLAHHPAPHHVSGPPPHLNPLAGPHPLGLPPPHPHPGVPHLAPPPHPGSFLPPPAGLAPHPFGVPPHHPAAGGVLVPPGGLGDFAAAMEAAALAAGARGGGRRDGETCTTAAALQARRDAEAAAAAEGAQCEARAGGAVAGASGEATIGEVRASGDRRGQEERRTPRSEGVSRLWPRAERAHKV
ncbi:hypothetical protein BESB_060290 [Besnoitia besnoiti]|uniref:KHDC4/BBP-like KH-domain type I domain-containing protein n=1 Tax=Besnoitia besnoiti TaxID=94643 RepID=A0A2A9MIB8_BESBE|nr:hypothetical protein BESB_060290 [Besnoitia besnoiti]PFH35142.1 hypothetical protein BESB_060290 [Besnoitia besnoiti]